MQIKYVKVYRFKTILYKKYNYSIFGDSAFSFYDGLYSLWYAFNSFCGYFLQFWNILPYFDDILYNFCLICNNLIPALLETNDIYMLKTYSQCCQMS